MLEDAITCVDSPIYICLKEVEDSLQQTFDFAYARQFGAACGSENSLFLNFYPCKRNILVLYHILSLQWA